MFVRFLFFIIIISSSIFSAYLKNVPQSIIQPDGSIIECFSSGDEFYNWVHDADGYTIVRSPDDGFCYYANSDLKPTQYRVGDINPQTIGLQKWIKIDKETYIAKKNNYLSNAESRTPTTGTVNNLNVFIRFSDESSSIFGASFSYYDAPFNLEQGPSMRHYFDEVSYGALDAPTSHFPIPYDNVVISYQDQYPRSYYQVYNAQTNPNGYNSDQQAAQREHILLKNAIEFIENQVPTDLVIDGDNDGNVDNVTFLVSGSPDAWADLLWPHRWVLYYEDARIHGKRVWDYNLNLTTGGYFTVGTLCHEFNHSLGAPDLYHYYSDGPTACGGWDVMDNSGTTPSYMGAFMKAKYGHWIEDTNGDGQNNEYDIPLLNSAGTYELNPLDKSTNYAYRIESPYASGQYFVVEYRRKQGLYEVYTPGNDDGLLVYRINTCCGGNADGPPDEVYIYRPGGDADTNGNLNTAIFNQSTGRNKINDTTNPSAFLYPNWTADNCEDPEGCPGGLFLDNIGDPGETIQFEYINMFLNSEFTSISNDSDQDGVLNPGEEATLNFAIQNTSSNSFVFEINIEMLENEHIDILTSPVYIDELAGSQAVLASFDIKVKDDAEFGIIQIGLKIDAVSYQSDTGTYTDYEDTIMYDLELSINQSGFPYVTLDKILSSPSIFDLDGDGLNEIIFGDNTGMFYILNQEDMSVENYYEMGDQIWGAPAIDDLDGDGDYEIAITSRNQNFYIFDHNGNLAFSPYDTEQYLTANPSIGYSDGNKLVYVPTYDNDGKILIFKINQQGVLEVDEFFVDEKIKSGIAVHDIDSDGNTDFVYGTDNSTLEVVINNQKTVYNVGDKIQTAPIILKAGDEYLAIAGSKDEKLYAFNITTESEHFVYETGGDVASPAMFEHSEYGPVIVFGSDDGFLYMVDINGNDISGWPKDLEASIELSPSIADLDGDGLADIVIGQSQGKLFILNEDGEIFDNFPINIGTPFTSGSSISDLDGDGDLEVLLGASDGLYGYDFGTENGSIADYWFMYRGDHQRSGFFDTDILNNNLNDIPGIFSIKSIYPNPFNPTTSINVETPNNQLFKLSIYNIKGALVEEIFSGSKPVGDYQFNWDASNYSSGIYFVNISSENYYKSHKIMLIK